MLEYLHACVSATIATGNRAASLASLGRGRDAVVRLATALALIVAIFGAVSWNAAGMEQHVRVAQPAGEAGCQVFQVRSRLLRHGLMVDAVETQ